MQSLVGVPFVSHSPIGCLLRLPVAAASGVQHKNGEFVHATWCANVFQAPQVGICPSPKSGVHWLCRHQSLAGAHLLSPYSWQLLGATGPGMGNVSREFRLIRLCL